MCLSCSSAASCWWCASISAAAFCICSASVACTHGQPPSVLTHDTIYRALRPNSFTSPISTLAVLHAGNQPNESLAPCRQHDAREPWAYLASLLSYELAQRLLMGSLLGPYSLFRVSEPALQDAMPLQHVLFHSLQAAISLCDPALLFSFEPLQAAPHVFAEHLPGDPHASPTAPPGCGRASPTACIAELSFNSVPGKAKWMCCCRRWHPWSVLSDDHK